MASTLATNETYKHKMEVLRLMGTVIELLIDRAYKHDNSKLEEPELSIFAKYTPRLANTTYGSEEYTATLKEMDVAIQHHYSHNRHHPEHFPNRVADMNLIDIIEMLCDWKASTARHNDGNILMSIDKNQERFGYSQELAQILRNTVKLFE